MAPRMFGTRTLPPVDALVCLIASRNTSWYRYNNFNVFLRFCTPVINSFYTSSFPSVTNGNNPSGNSAVNTIAYYSCASGYVSSGGGTNPYVQCFPQQSATPSGGIMSPNSGIWSPSSSPVTFQCIGTFTARWFSLLYLFLCFILHLDPFLNILLSVSSGPERVFDRISANFAKLRKYAHAGHYDRCNHLLHVQHGIHRLSDIQCQAGSPNTYSSVGCTSCSGVYRAVDHTNALSNAND